MEPATVPDHSTISQTPFELPIRRGLRWDFEDIELKFVSDDILVNYLWAAFSIGAPGIERFFIAALRPLADQVADAKLRQDMENMLTQEAMHAATHAKFNRALAKKGLPIQHADAHIEAMLAWISANCTQMEMVGMVAAGEHLLYSFATMFLADDSVGAAMSPGARRLFDYHMLEEAEHGAVSHDIFRYFCGDNYLHRVRTALIALNCVRKLLLTTVSILIADGDERITWRNWLRFWSYSLVRPGLFRHMAVRLAQYLNPFYRLRFEGEDRAVRDRLEARLYATQPG